MKPNPIPPFLPWRIDGTENAEIDGQSYRVAIIRDPAERWVAYVETEDAEGEANAAQIVRAVNGYPAAIEALRQVVGAFDSPGIVLPDSEPLFTALAAARAVLRDDTIPEVTPTRAELDALAAQHGITVREDARAGCFNLYWPDKAHAFAVSVRDAIETIRFNERA